MISVVIPIYNEESLLGELVKRTITALQHTGQDFELLFVDDGSTDNSMDLLLQLHTIDKRIKIMSLSRNFGHQAAYTAGIDYAQGEYLVLMDGDLQDPPELIPQMFTLLNSGSFDIVNGYRKANTSRFTRNIYTRIFHQLFKRLSAMEDIEHIGNFSMLNKAATHALRTLTEKSRYLPGLRHFIGFRKTSISYQREKRGSGCSMSTRQLFTLACDAIFSFSKLPLKFCLIMGIIGIITSFLAGIYILLSKHWHSPPLAGHLL